MKALAPALLAAVLVLAGCGAFGGGGPSGAELPSRTAAPSQAPSASALELAPEIVAGPDPEIGPPPVPEIASLTVATPGPGSVAVEPPSNAYVADYCVARDWLTPYVAYPDHARTVVDPTYTLPADYVPPDLVAVSGAGFAGSGANEQVRALVIDDLAALRIAGESAGAGVEPLSGYRSYAQQQATFDYWSGVLGYEAAAHRAARPGHSEHQLGTSLDFSSPGWTGRFGDWATESPSGAWMAEHAWEYGFVMSYPAGGDLATCYGYEPWHYRWIGRTDAAAWHATELTLHEFLVAAGTP